MHNTSKFFTYSLRHTNMKNEKKAQDTLIISSNTSFLSYQVIVKGTLAITMKGGQQILLQMQTWKLLTPQHWNEFQAIHRHLLHCIPQLRIPILVPECIIHIITQVPHLPHLHILLHIYRDLHGCTIIQYQLEVTTLETKNSNARVTVFIELGYNNNYS